MKLNDERIIKGKLVNKEVAINHIIHIMDLFNIESEELEFWTTIK